MQRTATIKNYYEGTKILKNEAITSTNRSGELFLKEERHYNKEGCLTHSKTLFDGSTTECTITYDTNNNIIEDRTVKDDKEVICNVTNRYNENNYIIYKRKYTKADTTLETWEYHKNKKIKSYKKVSNGIPVFKFKYDEEGRIIEEENNHYLDNKKMEVVTKYEYGKKETISLHYSNGELAYKLIHTFDNDDNTIQIIEENYSSKYNKESNYEYNEKGDLIKSIEKTHSLETDEVTTKVINIEYDEDEKILETVYIDNKLSTEYKITKDGNVHEKIFITYDEKGNISHEDKHIKHIMDDGLIINHYENGKFINKYIYDNNGNVLHYNTDRYSNLNRYDENGNLVYSIDTNGTEVISIYDNIDDSDLTIYNYYGVGFIYLNSPFIGNKNICKLCDEIELNDEFGILDNKYILEEFDNSNISIIGKTDSFIILSQFNNIYKVPITINKIDESIYYNFDDIVRLSVKYSY